MRQHTARVPGAAGASAKLVDALKGKGSGQKMHTAFRTALAMGNRTPTDTASTTSLSNMFPTAPDSLEQCIEASRHVGAALRRLQGQPLHIVRQRLRRQPEDLQGHKMRAEPMPILFACTKTQELVPHTQLEVVRGFTYGRNRVTLLTFSVFKLHLRNLRELTPAASHLRHEIARDAVPQPQQEQAAVVQQVRAVRIQLAALRRHARRQHQLPLLVARAPVACKKNVTPKLQCSWVMMSWGAASCGRCQAWRTMHAGSADSPPLRHVSKLLRSLFSISWSSMCQQHVPRAVLNSMQSADMWQSAMQSAVRQYKCFCCIDGRPSLGAADLQQGDRTTYLKLSMTATVLL